MSKSYLIPLIYNKYKPLDYIYFSGSEIIVVPTSLSGYPVMSYDLSFKNAQTSWVDYNDYTIFGSTQMTTSDSRIADVDFRIQKVPENPYYEISELHSLGGTADIGESSQPNISVNTTDLISINLTNDDNGHYIWTTSANGNSQSVTMPGMQWINTGSSIFKYGIGAKYARSGNDIYSFNYVYYNHYSKIKVYNFKLKPLLSDTYYNFIPVQRATTKVCGLYCSELDLFLPMVGTNITDSAAGYDE